MKKMMMVALVMMASASVFGKNVQLVKVLSKQREIVYFKVDASMIGAALEVYNENGDLVYSEKVTTKRQIVDFFDEPSGSYTIHVMKDGKEEVIEYLRK
jgi:hypothetical protein